METAHNNESTDLQLCDNCATELENMDRKQLLAELHRLYKNQDDYVDTLTDDQLLHAGIAEYIPALFCDINVSALYHNPSLNKPNEVMYNHNGLWVSADWFSLPIAHNIRSVIYKSSYHSYENIVGDSIKKRVKSIINDVTRIHGDFVAILDAIKTASSRHYITWLDPDMRDLVGSYISQAARDWENDDTCV